MVLPPGQLAALIRAQAMLVWAQLLVWVVPRGRLVGVRRDQNAPSANAQLLGRARHVGQQVVQVGAHGVFRPKCLVRAVAIQRLLEREHIHGGAVHIGVRMVDDVFEAHAWVEYGGAVIGDREQHVRTFSELAKVERVSGG